MTKIKRIAKIGFIHIENLILSKKIKEHPIFYKVGMNFIKALTICSN